MRKLKPESEGSGADTNPRGDVGRCAVRRTTGLKPRQDHPTCHRLVGEDPGRRTEHQGNGGRSGRPHQRTGRTLDETVLRHTGGRKIPEVRHGGNPGDGNDPCASHLGTGQPNHRSKRRRTRRRRNRSPDGLATITTRNLTQKHAQPNTLLGGRGPTDCDY